MALTEPESLIKNILATRQFILSARYEAQNPPKIPKNVRKIK